MKMNATFFPLPPLFRSQRAKVTRSPDREERERERGIKEGKRPIQSSLLRHGCLLYKSFAKVRQFAFSSPLECDKDGGTPPPSDNISTFYPLFFLPSPTIFSFLHSYPAPSRLFFFLLSHLSFFLSSPRFSTRENRGVSFYANSSSREGGGLKDAG